MTQLQVGRAVTPSGIVDDAVIEMAEGRITAITGEGQEARG